MVRVIGARFRVRMWVRRGLRVRVKDMCTYT